MAGQVIYEDLLERNCPIQGKKFSPWVRRILIRMINIIPASIAISLGYDPLMLLVVSQVILSFLIPLPMIPLILYTRSKKVMGEFVNRSITNVLAFITAIIIIGLNAYLIVTSL
jgi:manganese transport protein